MENSLPIITVNQAPVDNSIKGKIGKLFNRLKSLPIKTKSLLSIGMTVVILVALPLTVATLVYNKTSFFNRAASGEASGEPPCTASLPLVSITPLSITAYPGESKNFTVTVKDQCKGGSYQATTIKNGDFWSSNSPTILNLAPNQTGTFNVTFGTVATIAAKTYTVSVSIIGPVGTAQADVVFTVIAGTPSPTLAPTPSPTLRPTATPSATPLPTRSPKPTVAPISKVVISTSVLPIGRVNFPYSASVTGYSTNPSANLNMVLSNLPRGLSTGPCARSVSQNTARIYCYIQGKPTSWGLTFVKVTLSDGLGRMAIRNIPFLVSPSFSFRSPAVSPF